MKNDAETQQLIEALASAMPDLDETQQHLAVTLYRTLAEGRPVELSGLATRAGLGESLVRETVESWTGVFRDDEGRIVGFWGLALPEMAHRLEVDGVGIYTWCAYDPLFIVPLLGTPGRVARGFQSRAPILVTGDVPPLAPLRADLSGAGEGGGSLAGVGRPAFRSHGLRVSPRHLEVEC